MENLLWGILLAIGIPFVYFLLTFIFRLIEKPRDLSKLEGEMLFLINNSLRKISEELGTRDLIISTMFTIIVGLMVLASSYYIGFYLIEKVYVIYETLFYSFIISSIVKYLSREKTFSRSVTGGMERSFTIAAGSFILSLGGSLYGYSRAIAETPSSYVELATLITALIFIGFVTIFVGAKEGPVYGWIN